MFKQSLGPGDLNKFKCCWQMRRGTRNRSSGLQWTAQVFDDRDESQRCSLYRRVFEAVITVTHGSAHRSAKVEPQKLWLPDVDWLPNVFNVIVVTPTRIITSLNQKDLRRSYHLRNVSTCFSSGCYKNDSPSLISMQVWFTVYTSQTNNDRMVRQLFSDNNWLGNHRQADRYNVTLILLIMMIHQQH